MVLLDDASVATSFSRPLLDARLQPQVACSALSPRASNRKIYFRYLLLHGRTLAPCLFSSQQNWLLVLQQTVLFALQTMVLLCLCWQDDAMRHYSPEVKARPGAASARRAPREPPPRCAWRPSWR